MRKDKHFLILFNHLQTVAARVSISIGDGCLRGDAIRVFSATLKMTGLFCFHSAKLAHVDILPGSRNLTLR